MSVNSSIVADVEVLYEAYEDLLARKCETCKWHAAERKVCEGITHGDFDAPATLGYQTYLHINDPSAFGCGEWEAK